MFGIPKDEQGRSLVPIFSKASLREANQEAERLDYNRQIRPEFIEALADDRVIPVVFAMEHVRSFAPPPGAGPDIPHMRLEVILDVKSDGTLVAPFIDVTQERFNALPRRAFDHRTGAAAA